MMPLSNDTKHTHSNLAGVVIKKALSTYITQQLIIWRWM